MSKKLNGMITLNKIPKNAIKVLANGDKCIYVDIVERKAVSEKGFTHFISMFDPDTKDTVYLGNLKEQEFGDRLLTEEEGDDLPF